jgi:membrane fusion protein (multidrug efflux system)
MNSIELKNPTPEAAPKQVRLGRFALIVLALIVVALVVGYLPRLHARRALAIETRELAVPNVETVLPMPGKSVSGIALPAEIRAYVEAPIYARAGGYLKRWLVDIGMKVTAGQLLAEIETPELDQQLAQAQAELAQANASLTLAKTTADRWVGLLKTSSVAEQETAEKQADFELKKANVDAAQANVRRLEQLKSFANVVAPFAGTITSRQTDVGQLITAGGGKELFHLAQIDPLRIYVRVPQSLSRSVKPGQQADLIINELPGKKFGAKVVSTADAIEPDSRTLLVQLEVNNSAGEILAGSFAQVSFAESAAAPILTLPGNALLYRSEGMQVGIVGDDNKVTLHSVKLGRDYGQTIEVLDGVTAHDRVIVNPADSLSAGTAVNVIEPEKAVSAK